VKFNVDLLKAKTLNLKQKNINMEEELKVQNKLRLKFSFYFVLRTPREEEPHPPHFGCTSRLLVGLSFLLGQFQLI
jgi:hypothetical protein